MGDVSAGAEALYLLAGRLKDTGEVGLRRELDKAIRDAARPVLAEIRRGLPDYLPDPYAVVLGEDLQLSLSERTTDSNPGVQLRATTRGRGGRRRIRRLDDTGVLWHPLFGNRKRWYGQTSHVRAGFFTDPAQRSAPQVRDAILSAMSDVASRVTGGV
jgi:hypothetical protein